MNVYDIMIRGFNYYLIKGDLIMKKMLALLLSAALILSVFAFVGCGKTEEKLNLGFGVYTSAKATDAT